MRVHRMSVFVCNHTAPTARGRSIREQHESSQGAELITGVAPITAVLSSLCLRERGGVKKLRGRRASAQILRRPAVVHSEQHSSAQRRSARHSLRVTRTCSTRTQRTVEAEGCSSRPGAAQLTTTLLSTDRREGRCAWLSSFERRQRPSADSRDRRSLGLRLDIADLKRPRPPHRRGQKGGMTGDQAALQQRGEGWAKAASALRWSQLLRPTSQQQRRRMVDSPAQHHSPLSCGCSRPLPPAGLYSDCHFISRPLSHLNPTPSHRPRRSDDPTHRALPCTPPLPSLSAAPHRH